MARQYGGKTGPFQTPSRSAAPGAWYAPTEVFRQRTVQQWPTAIPTTAAVCPLGSVVFALTSGVVNQATASQYFVVASGGVLNRTAESELFAAFGTTFGSGNGTTTFNVPNLYDKFIYLKGTTVSGTTPVQASGQLGALHTHTFTYFTASSKENRTGNPGPGNRNTASPTVTSVSALSNVESTAPQNELSKRALIPLVCTESAAWPIGCAMPLLWPSYDGLSFPSSNYLICSGQQVSRTDFSILYSVLGNHYGSGNGSTTFNIPDLRGLFVSGPRQNGMIQPSGSPSSFEPSEFAAHQHRFLAGSFPVTNLQGFNTSYGFGSQPPASTSGGLLPNESRAANISVIWAMPVV